MATLIVTEYTIIGDDRLDRGLLLASEPALVDQSVTFTTATQSAAFNAKALYVRLQADAACHVKFAADPTATADHQPLNADQEYFRRVVPGQKVSVYDGTS